jgi:transglutaminase-like putative cysteine protease
MNRRLIFLLPQPIAHAARLGFLALTAIVGVAWQPSPANSQTTGDTQESWYLYRMAGQDVGHVHETMQRGVGDVTTTVETLIVINRLGSKVEIKGKSIFKETVQGQLRSAHSEMSSSQQTTVLDARVEKDAVRLLASTGGKEYRRELPYSGELLGPWGIRQRTVGGLKKQGDTLTCQTFVPEMERLAGVKRKLLETNASLTTLDAKASYAKVEEQLDGLPGLHPVWVDGTGRMVRQTDSGPFGETEIVLKDRVAALHAAGGVLPEEMFDRTLVRSNVRLPGPSTLERLVVRLKQKDATLSWPDFAGPGQTILSQEGNQLLLEVRQVKPAGTSTQPLGADGSMREYLEPNAIVQSDDSEVLRIAHEVIGDETDTFRAACKLRDWVSRSLKLDMGIALTPASEVIRQRKGTCAAYSIALASLARAAGIPSRVVMGYVYVSGIWGGHAWVEVRTGDQWVPLDAAIPSAGPTDAARIACVRTSLAEGPGPLLTSLARLFGKVQVSIVEYEVEGVCTKVPEGAPAFNVETDTYHNPWLGIEVRKPAGFRFARTDAVYPDTTVVAIEGPAGQRVDVRQADAQVGRDGEEAGIRVLRSLGFSEKPSRKQVGEKTAHLVEGARKAGLAFAQGSDLWVLTAEGEHASELVQRVAGMMKILPRGS